MNRGRPLLIIVLGIMAVVVVSVAVVLVAGGGEPQVFERGSPQAAVQAYLAAWEDDDYAAAYQAFSTEVRAEASESEYRRMASSWYGPDPPRHTAYIDSVSGSGDRMRVSLVVEEFYGGGIGGESYRSERTISMVLEDGAWKIDVPLIWLDEVSFSEMKAY